MLKYVLQGGTHYMPIKARELEKRILADGWVLKEKGISVYKYYVGEYATAIEMAGFSISLLKLDDELKEYIDHPVDTPFFKQV